MISKEKAGKKENMLITRITLRVISDYQYDHHNKKNYIFITRG